MTCIAAWYASPAPPGPDLPGDPRRLAPWSCLVGDVLEKFPQAKQAEPQAPAQWLLYLFNDGGDGFRLTFVLGLLQAVTRVQTSQ